MATPITNLAEGGLSDSEYARRSIEHLDAPIAKLNGEVRDLAELREYVAERQVRVEVNDGDFNAC